MTEEKNNKPSHPTFSDMMAYLPKKEKNPKRTLMWVLIIIGMLIAIFLFSAIVMWVTYLDIVS